MPGCRVRFKQRCWASLQSYICCPGLYIYGFAHVLFSAKTNSYVFGKAYPHAVWFYFPVAMLVKSSLTFLILLAISIWVIAGGGLEKTRELLFLLIPPLIYMAASMKGGMNIGIRHILPVYLFLAIVIAGAASVLIKTSRRWTYAVVLLLIFQAISVTRAYPSYIGYANEAFGRPDNVWRFLSDSSADWAQQLHAVKQYNDEHNLPRVLVRLLRNWRDRLQLLQHPMQAASDGVIDLAGHALRRDTGD